jgi:hypothetical protein
LCPALRGRQQFLPRNGQCVKEGLHRRFAIAPSSLMRALERMVGIAADRAGMARQYG